MRKTFKRIVSILIAGVSAFSVVACKNDSSDSDSSSEYIPELPTYSSDKEFAVATTANGDATVELKNEFFEVFGLEGDFTALPAGNWNVAMNLLGYYEWNGGAVTNSNVKSVTVTLMGEGSLTMKALQASRYETLNYVQDGQSSSGSLEKAAIGDINRDGGVDSIDVRLLMREMVVEGSLTAGQRLLADYNGDGKIDTGDARAMLLALAV